MDIVGIYNSGRITFKYLKVEEQLSYIYMNANENYAIYSLARRTFDLKEYIPHLLCGIF